MEYYGNKWCISMRELIDSGIMTAANYKQLAARKRLEVARPGKGLGSYALVVVDSLPPKYRKAVKERFPDQRETMLRAWVVKNYETDQGATAYYFNTAGSGIQLPVATAREYVTNASVLNTCIKLYNNSKEYRKLMGEKYSWDMMAATIEILKQEYGHTLPTSPLRFRKKVNDYKELGYGSLISGKFGNQSARRVDHRTEELVISIAGRPNKPWIREIYELYNAFVTGEIDICDPETGALYDRDNFTDAKGNPKTLSESTIANIVNKPKNRVLIERKQLSPTAFMHQHAPHMHRHAPEFSLSKVSFDDRDLPRKLKDTKQRPKAYYAYDVASDACIGWAYNRSKSVDLVVDMFRNMFRLLDRQGWGCPAEVEVEHHLMSQWKDSFLRAGIMFPFVRFCAPMNSQEKHAENCNGAKKKSIEHRNHVGVGRHYAKLRAYRTESVKVFDEKNNTYEEKNYYSWDELIADDMRDIIEYNNAPHHNQKKYPGMSRWDVLVANINPGLRPLDKATIARFIGERVETSIRRHSYCRVGGRDWWLSKSEVIDLLQPNNYKVDAYCLTDKTGEITDVFIYQGGMYIDRLEDPGTYNTARAERTAEDERIFGEQRKKIEGFRKYIDARAIGEVTILDRRKDLEMEVETLTVATPAGDEQPEPVYSELTSADDIRARARAAI